MDGSPQYDRVTADLDRGLLSTPFAVQTNWHVLTGAASSGKTTLINQLAELGFQTVAETARQYIELELARGRSFDEMFGNPADQKAMARMQLEIEQGLPATDVLFLDRAFSECITFYRFCGLSPDELLRDCFQRRYASVFILDRLPFQQDEARIDHDATSSLLDEWLARDYRALGYKVVRVPVLPPKERLAFILDNVSAQGLL